MSSFQWQPEERERVCIAGLLFKVKPPFQLLKVGLNALRKETAALSLSHGRGPWGWECSRPHSQLLTEPAHDAALRATAAPALLQPTFIFVSGLVPALRNPQRQDTTPCSPRGHSPTALTGCGCQPCAKRNTGLWTWCESVPSTHLEASRALRHKGDPAALKGFWKGGSDNRT